MSKNSFIRCLIFLPVLVLFSFSSSAQYGAEKNLVFQDRTYEPGIRSVQLYPASGNPRQERDYPAVRLNSGVPLVLEFDELTQDIDQYTVKILSCDADWKRSSLPDMEFLEDYNEFYVNEYELSFNTKTEYVHYRFQVPPVKVSGNYLLMVYGLDEEDLIITRRFMVYESRVGIGSAFGNIAGTLEAMRNQQIDFRVTYGGLNVINPPEQLKIFIRQNNRWDNAIKKLKPTFVRDHDKALDFNYFNLENAFKGGNEFRMFDIMNLEAPGFGTDSTQSFRDRYEVFLDVEKSRNGWVYNRLFQDMNGRFVPDAMNIRDPDTDADYVFVNFSFAKDELPGDIYVIGQLSNWEHQKRFKMTYNPDKVRYELRVLLKQGVYNYLYSFENSSGEREEYKLEGTHNRTENEYDILVYYRPQGARTDYLVGYRTLR